jgi:hypothetical protein
VQIDLKDNDMLFKGNDIGTRRFDTYFFNFKFFLFYFI